MSNPEGNTGYRTVKYVKPGETIVYYNDRELKIKTHGESNEDFASKVKARTGKVPKGYKTREQAYAERRAADKKRTEKALAEKKKAAEKKKKDAAKTTKAAAGTKARTKTAAPAAPAQRTSRKTSGRSTSRSSAPKSGFDALMATGKYVVED